MKYLLTIGIPALCLLMFLRELIVSYFVRPKFEMYVSASLQKMAKNLKRLEESLVHNVARMQNDIDATSKISNIVNSARAKLLASRSYILRFHNGSSFSTNTPVWKFSITNEATDSAIASIADCTRDILVSNNIQLLSPVFNQKSTDSGMKVLSKADSKKMAAVKIDADKIESNTIKGFMILRGIRHMYYAPITDIHGNAVGVFCIDYIGDTPEFLTDEYVTKELGEFSSMISTIFV